MSFTYKYLLQAFAFFIVLGGQLSLQAVDEPKSDAALLLDAKQEVISGPLKMPSDEEKGIINKIVGGETTLATSAIRVQRSAINNNNRDKFYNDSRGGSWASGQSGLKKLVSVDKKNFNQNGEAKFRTKNNKNFFTVKAPEDWRVGMKTNEDGVSTGVPASISIINRLRRVLSYGCYADALQQAKVDVDLARGVVQGEYLRSEKYFNILKDAKFISGENENFKEQGDTAKNALRLLTTLWAIRSTINQIIAETPLALTTTKTSYTGADLQAMMDEAKKTIFRMDLLDRNLLQFIKQYFPNIIKSSDIKGASFFDESSGAQPTLADAANFLKRSQDANGKNKIIKVVADVASIGDAISYLTGGADESEDTNSDEIVD